ncbi:MAG: GldG family protein [Oscillospiraceae bacterium]|nr:GldG family protein [Oscillospiraceae bacterium]
MDENKEIEVVEEVEQRRKFRFSFNSRKWKRGGFAFAISAMFIAAVILINLIVNTLLARFDVRVDLSVQGLYSIDPTTTDYLNDLGNSDKIDIYFCATEEEFSMRPQYFQATEIARIFAEVNPNIKVSFVNLLSNPLFAAEFDGNLRASDVVIRSENTGRYRVITAEEYILYEYFFQGRKLSLAEAEQLVMMYGYDAYDMIEETVSAGAERAFLSAILSVTDDAPVRVAYVDGYGLNLEDMSNINTHILLSMLNILEANSYLVEGIDLFLTHEIDPDIDFLILFAPTHDLSETALEQIDNWMDNNTFYGKTLLYFAPNRDFNPTPNLDAYLAEWWGVSVGEYVIAQQDSRFASPSSMGLEQYIAAVGEFAEGVTEDFVGRYMRPILTLFEQRETVSTFPLLMTYPGAFGIPFDTENEEAVGPSAFGVGAMSRRMRFEGLDPLYGQVLVFGSTEIFSPEYIESGLLSNGRFFLNIFNEISGKGQHSVQIIPQSFLAPTFEITERQANAISLFFVILIPLALIVTGLVVFFRRRYK